ncbi:MAG: DUF1570 domain-containing protein [Pirellulaceae bacterium]
MAKRSGPVEIIQAISVTFLTCLLLSAVLEPLQPIAASEQLTVKQNGKLTRLTGEILVEAQDGGLLFVARDGALWIVQPEQLQQRKRLAQEALPWSQTEMSSQLVKEMPAGFRIHKTAHFLICYNTSKAYAQWCGALYERLYRAFYGYWKSAGITLHEPRYPLVAMVFENRQTYLEYSRLDLGSAATAAIGYYNIRTNRTIAYDLTGVEQLKGGPQRFSSASHINRVLSQPAAERTVATVVHEATHQLAYNSGLQQRYADNPFWVSEGMAIFFETPDLKSTKGWRTLGGVNRVNLFNFRKYLRQRPGDSLQTLLSTDQRFRDPALAASAYAEAWALNYFLLRTRKDQYVTFLRKLAAQSPLTPVDEVRRLSEFKAAFGGDLQKFDTEFIRYMSRIR